VKDHKCKSATQKDDEYCSLLCHLRTNIDVVLIELHVERAHTDRQTDRLSVLTIHSEEHARVIPFTATAAHTPTAQ
jgi:hypothetical protein